MNTKDLYPHVLLSIPGEEIVSGRVHRVCGARAFARDCQYNIATEYISPSGWTVLTIFNIAYWQPTGVLLGLLWNPLMEILLIKIAA
jgi:hypothetical protein